MRRISPTGLRDRGVTWRDMAQAIGHWALRGHGLWALEEKGTGAFLGRVGIIRPEGLPEIELAYSLAREPWGRGFATEAGRAALDWAFGALGVPRVASFIAAGNVASQAVSQRPGGGVRGGGGAARRDAGAVVGAPAGRVSVAACGGAARRVEARRLPT
jgi:RimJ/RimL family protein N-acetyltransferase